MTRQPNLHIAVTTLAALVLLAGGQRADAQSAFDAGWYEPGRPYVKLHVAADGVFAVTGADLAGAGVPVTAIDPATFRLLENGREVPLYYSGSGTAGMAAEDYLAFVGRRNTGAHESYLYEYDPSRISSTYNSLFTDTTSYWLTWGGTDGLRLERTPPSSGTEIQTTTPDTLHLELDNTYYPGDSFNRGNPLYTDGEGFYWVRISHGTAQDVRERTYDVRLVTPTSALTDTAVVRVRLSGESTSRHNVELSLRLYDGSSSALTPVDTVDWTGLQRVTLEARVPGNRIPPDANLRVRLRSRNDFGSTIPNSWFLDWIDVAYERSLAAQAGQIRAVVQAAGDRTLSVTGLTADSVLALNPATGEIAVEAVAAGQASIRVSTTGDAAFWISGTDALLTPRIEPDAPSDLASTGNVADYVIIRPGALAGSASEMAAYRRSAAGGAYTVAEVSLEDIFDQFDYGRPTPIAIRRFVRATYDWSVAPEFFLLWGDALYPNRSRARQPWEVPSYGNTVSDAWFAMQNGGPADWSESVAVGRIPTRSNADGQLFVDKISGYESGEPQRWQKNAAYLVGGVSDVERRILQSNALSWSARAAADPTALDTLHFFKTSSDALDPTFKDSLQVAFESGLSWLTYFGHSAAQTWEIVTDPPATFNNAGRLPVILSLGCYTGDFATGSGSDDDLRSFSEQLVLDNLNGGIIHWGASSSGTIGASAALSQEIHQSVFTDTLRIIGEAFRIAKGRFAERFTDPLSIKHLLQYGLIGDPATRLAIPVRPELRMSPEQISIRPLAPIPADSNLTVTIRLENLGLTPADSVLIRATRVRPDRTTDIVNLQVPPFGLNAEESIDYPIADELVGEHTVVVAVDADDRYAEVDELNNAAERSVNVFATGLSIISPPPFGLVDTLTPTLRVTLSRREAGTIPISFQLDSGESFTSPDRQEYSTGISGLAADWQPAGLRDDSTYYWRARIEDGSATWQTGSFTIRTDLGKRGWLQQDDLFDENANDGYLERGESAWSLRKFDLDVSASSERGSGIWLGQFVVSGQRFERLTLGFGLLVIDGRTGAVKSHTSAATYPNDFFDPVAAYDTLVAQASRIEDGDYVFTRTRHLGNKDGLVEIADSVKAVFRDVHSVAIDTLTYRDLWIMFSRKGYPSETREWVEPPGTTNEILRDTTLTFSFGRGSTRSPVIGPAQEWRSLGWDVEASNPSTAILFDVLEPETGSVLIGNLSSAADPDLSSIDAVQHPLLALRATFLDSTSSGTPQLLQWHVEYVPVAELALDPLSSSISSDTLQEGQRLDITTYVENLADESAPSVRVDYYVTDASNQRQYVATDTLTALGGRASRNRVRELDTRGLVGDNTLEIRMAQPDLQEPIAFNNILVWPFHVQRDREAPTLEVIVEGEILPPDPDPVVNLQDPALPFVPLDPTIEIFINDENPFLPITGDTTIVRVSLDGNEIPASELTFRAAKQQGDRASVVFTPELPPRDTTHTVVVEAFDATGNPAADNPYQVHFRTQVDVEVESVYPYPNPMSTSTVFAFRLRGADAFTIEDFRLRIYTINGQLVREFDLIEDPSSLLAGTLRIGWNKLGWDGRDADGDAVATGVYLYRIFARSEGQELEALAMPTVEKVVVIR